MLQCSFGMAPSTLNVIVPLRPKCGNMLMANITDFAPMVNIMPFGMCQSMANPTVAGTVESRWTGEGHEYACTHQQRQMYVYLGWQYLCYQSQWKYDDSGKVIKGEKVRK